MYGKMHKSGLIGIFFFFFFLISIFNCLGQYPVFLHPEFLQGHHRGGWRGWWLDAGQHSLFIWNGRQCVIVSFVHSILQITNLTLFQFEELFWISNIPWQQWLFVCSHMLLGDELGLELLACLDMICTKAPNELAKIQCFRCTLT